MNNEFDQFLDEDGNLFFTEDATLVDYVERNVARAGRHPGVPVHGLQPRA